VEETTNMTTISPGLNENALPKEEYKQKSLSEDEAPVEGGDSRTSPTTPPQVDDTVRQGTDEEICGDERDIGEDSTLIGMDSQVLDGDTETTTENDNQKSTGQHRRQRKRLLSGWKGIIDDRANEAVELGKGAVKLTRHLLAKGGKHLVKLDEPGPDRALNQISESNKTVKVELNVKVSSSTNMPLRPFDPSIPHFVMDARQQDGGEGVKLNVETKIQAVASC
jgi:hypothetical protein